MIQKNLPADQMQHICTKLQHKRNMLLRAFAINLGLIVAFWLVSMTSFYAGLMEDMMFCSLQDVEMYTYDMIGLWKIAGVVLFLVPGLAAWWEMACCKQQNDVN
ncbi:MAG: hypothetical protein LBJ18_01040 [Rickettsiales bacterium]|jgi:hypothetical protein|nr:hypothetical protein [Rickettsiales bacterium]